MQGWERGRGIIAFRLEGRPIRMNLPLPDPEEFSHYERAGTPIRRTEEAARSAHEQAERQAWRALLLIVRAKLEAVESGITTVEEEFLAHMVLPAGDTIGERVLPQMDEAMRSGRLPGILPEGRAIPLPPAG